jgi:pimeloyl-ACP methyl ester carboxylesterase|tara:strand:- start:519 stop:1424 length:906 start_codon:yes stop_codon:yes gene_type:complete
MTDKAKASREKILLNEESFSYLFFEGSSPQNPIIFFHATGLNAATYLNLLTKIFEDFDGERSIYAFDQRGHGLSLAEADHTKLKSWKQFSKEAISFLNSLDHESVDLMGHSMGGIVASEVASQLKLKVQNLIMLEPVLYYAPKDVIKLKLKNFLKFDDLSASNKSSSAKQRRNNFASFEEAIEHFTGRAMFASWPQESIMNYLEGGLVKKEGSFFLSCDPAWEAKTFQTVTFDTFRFLKKATCPVLIIRGDKETSTFTDEAKDALLNKDRILIEEYKGTHFLPIENVELVSSRVFDFLHKD